MATNLKQKALDVRTHRRTRFKRALQPIMERFGCTQMECADRVNNLFYLEAENPKLKDTIDKLEKEVKGLRKNVSDLNEALDSEATDMEKTCEELDAEKAKVAALTTERDDLKAQLDAK